MCRRMLFLSLLLFQAGHVWGMQDSFIPMDLLPSILKHTIWQNEKDAALPAVAVIRNHTLQFVCRDFRRIFWDCFTLQQKDKIIAILLLQTKMDHHLVGIAVSMGASLYPILHYFVTYYLLDDAINNVSAIVDMADAAVMNQADEQKITPLHVAIRQGPIKMVKLLLSCPVVDVNKTLPLSTAVSADRIEKLKLLLAHPDIQINAVNELGETPLFALANELWLDIDRLRFTIDLLIKSGIDSTIKNNDGYTALDIVRDYARAVVAQELEKAFAVKK